MRRSQITKSIILFIAFLVSPIEKRSDTINAKPNKHFQYSQYCRGCFSTGVAKKDVIRNDLIKMLRVYKRRWSSKDLNNVAQVLEFGHNNINYKIDYRLVISFFGHESNMNIKESSRINRDGSRDFGIGQHNSFYYKKRFKQAIYIENKYNIVKNVKATYSPHDPVTGSIATLVFLKYIRSEIITRKARLNRRHMILAYNLGVNGMFRKNKTKRFRRRYYGEILRNYSYTL